MIKYNKEGIKRELIDIQGTVKIISSIPLKVTGFNSVGLINEYKKNKRILELELAVAELQEKCK